MTEKQSSNQNGLRVLAFAIAFAGAVGSLYFMFKVGHENNSFILVALFTVWVLSPFVALFIFNKISIRWSVTARAYIYWLMIVLAISSLVAYSGALIPPGTKPAFIFLVTPLSSWVLIVIVFLIAGKISKRG